MKRKLAEQEEVLGVDQGKLKEAEVFWRRRALWSDHSHTLDSVKHLGVLLRFQGKHHKNSSSLSFAALSWDVSGLWGATTLTRLIRLTTWARC